MGSRKKTKRQNTRRFKFENSTMFGILTLIVGAIGLYFAFRANNISSQQYKSNVVVLNEWNYGYDFDSSTPEVVLACVERVRFSNLGNAADSIVSYDTTVYYKNTESVFNGYGMATSTHSLLSPSSSRASYTASDELHSAIDKLEMKIAPDFAFGNQKSSIHGNVESVIFPYAINGFSTIDLEMSILFGVVPGNEFNLYYEKDQPLFTSEPTDLAPLEFEINFKFASGATAKTPRISCGTIGAQKNITEAPTPLLTSKSSLSSIVLDPPSPLQISFNQEVNITFNYTTDESSGVRIWAFPHFTSQNMPKEFSTNSSGIYPVGSGKGTAFIMVSSGETIVDQIILQIWNADKTVLLYETKLPVNYHFGN